jgi:hypothetical protein
MLTLCCLQQECRTEIDKLAALHAMIVYQVLGFFSDSPEQNRSGELHQPFLLKVSTLFPITKMSNVWDI